MKAVPPSALWSQLRQAVSGLARSADEQRLWLNENGGGVGCLFLELEDCAPLFFERLFQSGSLSDEVASAILDLLKMGDDIADTLLWDTAALDSTKEWANIRAFAGQVLAKMDNGE